MKKTSKHIFRKHGKKIDARIANLPRAVRRTREHLEALDDDILITTKELRVALGYLSPSTFGAHVTHPILAKYRVKELDDSRYGYTWGNQATIRVYKKGLQELYEEETE